MAAAEYHCVVKARVIAVVSLVSDPSFHALKCSSEAGTRLATRRDSLLIVFEQLSLRDRFLSPELIVGKKVES